MMQQAAGGGYPQPNDQQQQQQQQQQSPRGGMPKLSLLSHYAAAAAAAPPFSILGALEQQHFHHQMAPPHPHPSAFQNLLHQGFLITPAGQQGGYNLQLAAAAPPPQMLQGLMEDLIKLSPPGSPPPMASSSSSYNLVSLLEQKTEQLQALVRSLSQQQQQQQQQHNGNVQHSHAVMAAAQIASNISQIALGMLPNAPPSCLDMPPPFNLSVVTPTPMPAIAPTTAVRNPLPVVVNPEQQQQQQPPAAFNLQVSAQKNNANNANDEGEQEAATAMEDGDSAAGSGSRDEDDDGEAEAEVEAEGDGEGEGEELVPGSYDLVEMNAVEILAEHTHFCDKCGKGFKRDANLRMHMRGHGEQYKSPAALARPDKLSSQEPGAAVRPRRYSCPYAGCKRNKKHRKFQPLKTVLCVKNHYRRSHCPKSLTCSKCKSKKFSVVADLKTHEKHCGRDKWQCSCGTTFSRKDKLLGHISLFQGHTPAMPLNDHAALPHAPAPAPAPAPEATTSGGVAGVQGGSTS